MHVASPSRIEAAFTWTVRRFRWLRHVPFLPFVVDALFQLAVAAGDPGKLRAMRAIEVRVSSWKGVATGWHRYGGVAFKSGGDEFAHLHGCGLLDVWLGRDRALACIARGEAGPHHVFGESGWVSRWVRHETDVAGAVALLRAARETRPGTGRR